ncbi:hypothetical protein Y1Q_0019077 [Alligator mississippiensis]|uniref:Uncharacterized protein n=1 Tax=Alligator mississippiensis TaxID=8496 RepID=A0A151N0V8_ALLMI|nr:hypothetical protein Y1Q_0019077 [Alligator mississippiensis]
MNGLSLFLTPRGAFGKYVLTAELTQVKGIWDWTPELSCLQSEPPHHKAKPELLHPQWCCTLARMLVGLLGALPMLLCATGRHPEHSMDT